VRGVRDGAAGAPRSRLIRGAQRVLGALLTWRSGVTVRDPTSGFWAFGPGAVRFLGEHHPTGYPEPELLLLLRRNGMRLRAVPVAMRARAGGRTSLTLVRTGAAGWRFLLAALVVPLRSRVIVGVTRHPT
jgi:hypothetical protein